MTTISLVATDQLLSVALQPKVASGDQNSVELHVDFDSEWDGYGKSAVFFTSENKNVYEMVLTDGNCVIPHEVLAKAGVLYIGIRGVNSDDNAVKTSSLVKYKVAEGAPAGDGTTVEPTADVYQQLLTAYEKNSKEIKEYVDGKCKGTAGIIYPLATKDVPKGFLLCDGSAYSRTEYAELFSAIGTVYGEGDGITTFNVPNLSTRVPVGSGGDYELGAMGGEAEHKLTIDEMPSHDHRIQVASTNTGSLPADATIRYNSENTAFTGDGISTKKTGSGQPHNIMQPYTVVNYIISTGKEIEFVVGGTGSGGSAEPGVDGTTFYPFVSEKGVISWTNDGGKENPKPVDLVSSVIAALPIYNGEVESV